MTDLLAASRAELLQLINDLIAESESLKIQIAELKAQLAEKNPPGPGKPNLLAFVKPNRKKQPAKSARKRRVRSFAPLRIDQQSKSSMPMRSGPIARDLWGNPRWRIPGR